jgi:hypothetical protein
LSGPPTNIPASTLWLKLAATERPSKIVDFPRQGNDGNPIGQLSIRILTQEEQDISSLAAETFSRKYLKDGKKDELGYERLYSDGLVIETLFRACRDAEDLSRSAFPTPDHIRKGLTTEECAVLFQHYLTVQLELGPLGPTASNSMSDQEMEAWIDRLAQGGSTYPLDTLSSDSVKLLVLHMVYLLRPLQKDKSSVTSPPDETTSRDELPQSE